MKRHSLLLLLGLTGCSDNPLLGAWVLESPKQAQPGLICKEIEFTADKQICDDLVFGVEYEIRDDAVLLTQKTESLFGEYGIKISTRSPGRLAFTNPLNGHIVYWKRKTSR